MDVDTRWFDDERVRWECARAWCRPARRQLRALLEFIISKVVVPASGFSKRNRASTYVSRTDTRHSPHSSPRTMTRHRGSESCLALVYTLLLATLVVSSSAALAEATTRTASPLVSKDTLTTATGRQQQHSVATRTPPALAAQPRVDINASLREIHTNNTNATDAHGNVEQSRWWWWWTWWAAPRVVYIYPGHQQQYPHNPYPYPPVQPPLVEPNCPQVSLF